MSSRRVEIVILCEGKDDYDFASRVLSEYGLNPRTFRRVMSPRGEGAGSGFVLRRYAPEVRALRWRSGTARVGGRQRGRRVGRNPIIKLLAMVDADVRSVAERERTLARALREAGQAPRRKGERIAHWIPKRNVETWVKYWNDGEAEEVTDYKHRTREEHREPAARQFGKALRQGHVQAPSLPALMHGVGEFERLR